MSTRIAFKNVHAVRGSFQLELGDAEFASGAVTVLLGANGSGKTTALRLAAGLDAPARGSVLIDGQQASRLTERTRAGRVAFVPQRPTVGAPFSVEQVVALGRYALPPSDARVREALQQVRLEHRAADPFHSLSTGQQQRVALARALAQHQPGGALILDESLGAVDPPETHQLVHLLRRMARDGCTVVMAAHDLALAAALGDHVWFLAHGKIAASGPAKDILNAATLGALTGIPIVTAAGSGGTLPVPDLTAMLKRDP